MNLFLTSFWAGMAILSMTVYAFTGQTSWVPIDPTSNDGAIRFFLLLVAHLGWIPVLVYALSSKNAT